MLFDPNRHTASRFSLFSGNATFLSEEKSNDSSITVFGGTAQIASQPSAHTLSLAGPSAILSSPLSFLAISDLYWSSGVLAFPHAKVENITVNGRGILEGELDLVGGSRWPMGDMEVLENGRISVDAPVALFGAIHGDGALRINNTLSTYECNFTLPTLVQLVEGGVMELLECSVTVKRLIWEGGTIVSGAVTLEGISSLNATTSSAYNTTLENRGGLYWKDMNLTSTNVTLVNTVGATASIHTGAPTLLDISSVLWNYGTMILEVDILEVQAKLENSGNIIVTGNVTLAKLGTCTGVFELQMNSSLVLGSGISKFGCMVTGNGTLVLTSGITLTNPINTYLMYPFLYFFFPQMLS